MPELCGTRLSIAIFGSSIVSSYWNGAATYYRGIARALSERGHRVRFFEPDALGRQQNRDEVDLPLVEVIVYEANESGAARALESARGADLVAKASGVGVLDAWLEKEVLALKSSETRVAFWDVDAPATLERCQRTEEDPFRALIPKYDLVFTYGGGDPVVSAYEALGAARCVPIYNALDPTTHHPVDREARFGGLLGFLGNRLPDRESRVEDFLFRAAEALPNQRFLLGGSGWEDKSMPANVVRLGHVGSADHNAFNVSPMAVLNINRDSMARYGFSPPTRVFEAAGAGACLLTDAWAGIEQFLAPELEVLVASSGDEVAQRLRDLTHEQATVIGSRARRRVLAEHTYAHRAFAIEHALGVGNKVQKHSAPGLPTIEEGPVPPSLPGLPEVQSQRLRLVILGLSITSSWGNGHATTYRALVRELSRLGHEVLFLERDVPWYANSRDLPHPPYGKTEIYQGLDHLSSRFSSAVRDADAVIVGSYVPEGTRVAEWVLSRAKGVVAFYDIDTPITLAKLAQSSAEYLTAELVPRFDLYLSFSGGPVLTELQRRWAARRAVPLYCAADTEHYFPESRSIRYDLGYLGTYSGDRQPALERLCLEVARTWPEGRFAVAGAQYPSDTAFPANVRHISHLPPSSHRHFYNEQRFALNLTRSEMISTGYSPSVRLFEAAACGTPVISDHWPGLGEFFEVGTEILVAESSQDAARHLQLLSEAERLAMGLRARQRILENHTPSHRVAQLLGYLESARADARLAAQ